jgi:UDP-N-acetylmuramoyl-L-alanyl-D-glutamate--2,6-diaminopimelate ligase
MERVENRLGITLLVDYAHTGDALENVLTTLSELAVARIITVFGCGGDRDPGKRPIMGRIAAAMSDLAIVTSDNPRSEKPEAIVLDILNGIESKRKAVAVVDRKLAIQSALEEARPGDTVVIAGKGHETYQQIGSEKIPFDDAAIAESVLKVLGVWNG